MGSTVAAYHCVSYHLQIDQGCLHSHPHPHLQTNRPLPCQRLQQMWDGERESQIQERDDTVLESDRQPKLSATCSVGGGRGVRDANPLAQFRTVVGGN